MIHFTVEGRPQPAGSKRAFPVRRANGRTGVAVTDANPLAKLWKTHVREAAQMALRRHCGGEAPAYAEGPIRLLVTFYFERPKSHYGSGRNARVQKPSAPGLPTTRPDTTKLLRAVEDALTGVIWRDDAQVVDQTAIKRYTPGYSYCVITVEDAQP